MVDTNTEIQTISSDLTAYNQNVNIVRTILATKRAETVKTVSVDNLATTKDYATSISTHNTDVFATGMAKPSIVEIKPETITNPLISVNSLDSDITVDQIKTGINSSTDLSLKDKVSVDTTDVSGSAYATTVTGGVVAPKVAASIADRIKARAGSLAESATTGVTPDAGFTATVTNYLSGPQGSGLVDVATSSMSGKLPSTGVTKDLVESCSGSMLPSISDGSYSMDSLSNAISLKGMSSAVGIGDISQYSILSGFTSVTPNVSFDNLLNMSETMIQNPSNMGAYIGAFDSMGYNFNEVVNTTVSTGSKSVFNFSNSQLVASGVVTEGQLADVSGKLSSAYSSPMFKKVTRMGNNLAKEYMDRGTYRKLSAVSDITGVLYPNNTKRRNSVYSKRNDKLGRAASTLFNDGKPIINRRVTNSRFNSNSNSSISSMIKAARVATR